MKELKNDVKYSVDRPRHRGVNRFLCLFFMLLAGLSLMNGLVSCSDDDDDDTSPTATPTPTFTPTPTPEPQDKPIITNLWPSHYTTAELRLGDSYYVDSTGLITEFPAFFNGSQAIRTALADADNDSFPFVSFTVDRPVELFICYDTQAASQPNWVQVFPAHSGAFVSIGSPVDRRYQVLQLNMPAGTIMLGGNGARGAMGSPMTYLIFVQPLSDGFSYPAPRRIPYVDYYQNKREWFCQFPSNYLPDGQTPLLFYFQGAQVSYEYIGKSVESTGLMESCEERGLILLAPEIHEYNWYGAENGVYDSNDVAFVHDILLFSRNYFPHHGQKVFGCGFSAGAYFLNMVALIEPRQFHGIAPFAGGIPDLYDIWPQEGDETFNVVFLVGDSDYPEVHEAVQLAYFAYDLAGYPVDFWVVPSWGHDWAGSYNQAILDYFLND